MQLEESAGISEQVTNEQHDLINQRGGKCGGYPNTCGSLLKNFVAKCSSWKSFMANFDSVNHIHVKFDNLDSSVISARENEIDQAPYTCTYIL